VERGQAGATVFQGADVRLVIEFAVLGSLNRIEDGNIHALEHRGDDIRAVGRLGLAAITVNPDGIGLSARGLHSLQRTVSSIARHRQNDIGTLVEQCLSSSLTTRDVLERVGLRDELTVLLLDIPTDSLNRLVLLLVVVVNALGKTIHEDGDGRDLHAAEGGNLAGLGQCGSQVAGLKGRLGSVEDQRFKVLRRIRRVVVNDGELDVRVCFGSSEGGLLEQEPNGDDDRALGVHHGLQVGGVVLIVLRLDLGGLHAEIARSLVETLKRGLVEGFVVKTSRVGDHTGLKLTGVGVILPSSRRGGTRRGARGRVRSLRAGRQ